jgi:secondary thiamine-phosphate synthase enzyme
MLQALKVGRTGTLQIHHDTLTHETASGVQFLDITRELTDFVASSGVEHGFLNVQSTHTTAAIVVNEHEPLLLDDMKKLLERMAPADAHYAHDDFSIRTVNLEPDEPPNGHSHCKSLFLPSSETLNVLEGRLHLGRWQRVFLVELDGPRKRTVSLTRLGI